MNTIEKILKMADDGFQFKIGKAEDGRVFFKVTKTTETHEHRYTTERDWGAYHHILEIEINSCLDSISKSINTEIA